MPAKGNTLFEIGASVVDKFAYAHLETIVCGALSLAGFILARRYLKPVLQAVGFSFKTASCFPASDRSS